MKLGMLSAIMAENSFEEVIDTAARIGYTCVEVACWPKGKAERRYAGVSHIDVEHLDERERDRILSNCREKRVEISALSYYPNPMDENLEKREASVRHLKRVIEAAAFLGVGTVGTFAGRMPSKTVEENLELFREIWPPIVAFAEEKQVRIAIENCPMLFTEDEWPGGQNLAVSPAIWRRMFEIIPSRYFGLNYDPSHFIWQQMDYIKPLREFRDRIFHIHFKDIKLYREKLDECGVLAAPLQYMSPKLPGLGDVQWNLFISALYDIGYDGCACVEIEDKAFEGSPEKIRRSLELSFAYLGNLIG